MSGFLFSCAPALSPNIKHPELNCRFSVRSIDKLSAIEPTHPDTFHLLDFHLFLLSHAFTMVCFPIIFQRNSSDRAMRPAWRMVPGPLCPSCSQAGPARRGRGCHLRLRETVGRQGGSLGSLECAGGTSRRIMATHIYTYMHIHTYICVCIYTYPLVR